MKLRTQVQLEPEDHEALRRWARRQGVSMSGALRLLIRRHLTDERPADRVSAFLSAAGSLPSSLEDEGRVGEDHDRFLYGSPGDR
jgi:hypothetical protein